MEKRQLINISGTSQKPEILPKFSSAILDCAECGNSFRISASNYNAGVRRCGWKCFSIGVSKRKRTHEHNMKIGLSQKGRKQKPWTESQREKHIKQRTGIYPFRNKTKEQLKEIYSKIAKSNSKPRPNRRGEKSSSWKGGISKMSAIIRSSFEYKEWRKKVFERDNYTCIWCGTKFIKGVTGDVVLNADHIKSFAEYPELRLDINNGRTLCVPCHKTTETYQNRWTITQASVIPTHP